MDRQIATLVRRRWPPRYRLAGPLAAGTAMLVAVVLTVIEATDERVATFWSEHPVATALMAGAIVLALGAFGVGEWTRRRELRAWQQVSRVAYRALVQELGDVRRHMSQLVSAREDPFDDGLRVDQRRRDELGQILRRHPEEDDLLGVPCEQGPRLEQLLNDWEYAKAFNRRLIELKRDHYATIAAWSPVMLQAPELAADLNALTRVGDELTNLGRRLFELDPLRRERTGWRPSPKWARRVVDHFRRVRVRAYLISEELERKADFAWHDDKPRPPTPLRSLEAENRLVDDQDCWDR